MSCRPTTIRKQFRGGVRLFLFFITGFLVLHAHLDATAEDEQGIQTLAQFSLALNRVAERVIPTVVFVQVEKSVQPGEATVPFEFNNPFDLFNEDFFERFFGDRFPGLEPRREQRQMGWGSGFIISEDGMILTSHHVIGEADRIIVRLRGGREFTAKVVGSDPPSDVAIIKIDNGEVLPVLPLGNSDDLLVGELVMAVGNPFGLSQTLTTGVVSAKGRTSLGITDYEDFIQTDAPINPGNSGGPLINMDGEAIGVNTAIFSQSGGYMGIGFAVPINMVKAVMDQLLERGSVSRGFLGIGIQDLTPELRETLGLREDVAGVLITEVQSDSPAARAGLQRGDIVVQYNGEPVKEVGHFRNMVALGSPGTEVTLTIVRNSEKMDISLELGSLKPEQAAPAAPSDVPDQLGFSVQNLAPELADQLGYQGLEGVIITEVFPGSPAALVGLRPGMLIREANRKPVGSVEEFLGELKNAREQGRLLLFVQFGKASQYVVLPLE